MNAKDWMPYVASLVILGLWGALVWTGKTPAGDFITALQMVLSGLGVHTIHVGVDKAVTAKAAATSAQGGQQ